MKGVIALCLKELVERDFGADKWADALEQAGLPRDMTFLPIDDVDDAAVMKVVEATCDVLGMSLQQAADAFGTHWACEYAPKMYAAYYAGVNSAKEFLLKLDSIHVATTRTVPNAHPPRFEYEDVDDNTLVMEYHSDRELVPFFTGLVRGIAEHYGEKADVSLIGHNKVRISFSRP